MFFVAGDSNLWIPELVPIRGARAADRSSRAILDSIIADHGLEIANPINQATHRAGAALDIILASPGLLVKSRCTMALVVPVLTGTVAALPWEATTFF